MKRITRAACLLACGIVLFVAGGVVSKMMSSTSMESWPSVARASGGTFDLTKRVTSKQFTVYKDRDGGAFDSLNRKVDRKVNNYLSQIGNLSDYQVHISRVGSQAGNVEHDIESANYDSSSDNGDSNSETVTITFIRNTSSNQ